MRTNKASSGESGSKQTERTTEQVTAGQGFGWLRLPGPAGLSERLGSWAEEVTG